MIAPSSYGALSATSENTIQGSRPTFTNTSGAKKLGFKIDDITYSESEGNLSSSPSVVNYLNAGLTLRDFKVLNLTTNDFDPSTDYYDADGDEAHPTAAFLMSPSTYEWRDRTGALVPSTKYNETLGCGNTSLKLPLTLKIRLPNVKVRSRYGNPSESFSTELVQEYKIGTTTGICFAKPGSLYWEDSFSGSPNRNPTYGGGYHSAEFDPNNGFRSSLSPKFPTTGFPGAHFYLVMTSNAGDYTFTHNGGTAVTVGTDGKVTLNRKPSGAVTIKAKYRNTSQIHEYTFDPRTVWVAPKSSYVPYANAKVVCGGESNIPSRAQLTNSPLTGGSHVYNTYTRAVDGSLFGEWGWTTNSYYPGSQWVHSLYWTREPWSSSTQFVVDSSGGYVNWYYTSTSVSCYVACLE
ncbi:hypothetical protein RCS94_07320 [Orbaceae bacterium ac157xtp]